MDAKLRCDEDGHMNPKSQDLEEIYPAEKSTRDEVVRDGADPGRRTPFG